MVGKEQLTDGTLPFANAVDEHGISRRHSSNRRLIRESPQPQRAYYVQVVEQKPHTRVDAIELELLVDIGLLLGYVGRTVDSRHAGGTGGVTC